MGMDVFGRAPAAPEGEYFRRTVWGWHPLADLCEELEPEISAACHSWHSNDGCGLDATDATKLAERLRQRMADGSVAAYIAIREAALKQLLAEPCIRCSGAGVFSEEPRVQPATTCRSCKGTGKQPAVQKHYGVKESDVREWIEFLQVCGGFQIC